MLPKANRLSSADLKRLGRPISQVYTGFLKLSFYNSNSRKAKFAIIIPKRFVKRAVDRNKLKRQISHTIAKNLDSITHQNIVILAINPPKNFSEKKLLKTLLRDHATQQTSFKAG